MRCFSQQSSRRYDARLFDQFDFVKNKIKGSLNSSVPVLKSKNGKIDLNYLFDFNYKKETYNEFLTLNSKWEWLELSRIFLNDSLSMATQSFSKDWDPIRFKSGLNQSLGFSIGNKYEAGKKSLGFNSGISYKRKFNFYEGAEVGQYIQTGEGSNALTPQKIGLETRGDETIFASLFGSISLHLNENHKLKVMSMLNQNGQSSARYFDGENMSDAFGLYEEQRTHRYLERQLKTIQLSGEHNFNSIKKSEIKWNLGFTKATQNTPDLKVFVNSYEFPEVEDEETGDFFLDTVPTFSIQTNLYPGPTRYFRFLEEDNFNFKTDYKLDFNEEEFLKIGFSFLEKNRSREEYRYTIDASGINYNNDINSYFNDNNMIVGQSSTGMNGTPMYLFAIDNTEIRNQYNASQKILGSYIMTTLKPIELLECTFGVRYENTDILAESADKSADIGVLKNSDFLPAMSAKYNLDESTKIRISYSKTLARPSFREISPTNWYDFQTALTFVGNPNLKRSLINNIDMRFEKYLSGAGLISLSGFYKKFNNPIEQVMNPQAQNTELSWRNVDEATVLGIEFEYKKKIILDEAEYLNIGFNGSIIHSETEIDSLELILIRAFDPNHASTRPMYGQSPYIVNFYSQYQKLGWNVGASYNVSGESIVIIQKGAVEALNCSKEWFKELNKTYIKRRKIVWEIFDILGCSYNKESAGLFVWAKLPKGRSAIEFTDQLLKEKDVFMTPGSIFGKNGKDYVRASLCVSEADLSTVLKRLKGQNNKNE